jgi:hypothetical protein
MAFGFLGRTLMHDFPFRHQKTKTSGDFFFPGLRCTKYLVEAVISEAPYPGLLDVPPTPGWTVNCTKLLSGIHYLSPRGARRGEVRNQDSTIPKNSFSRSREGNDCGPGRPWPCALIGFRSLDFLVTPAWRQTGFCQEKSNKGENTGIVHGILIA